MCVGLCVRGSQYLLENIGGSAPSPPPPPEDQGGVFCCEKKGEMIIGGSAQTLPPPNYHTGDFLSDKTIASKLFGQNDQESM